MRAWHNLKEWLAMSGMRLTDLSEEIGVPYRTLQNHFRGASRIPATTLLKILDRFNLNSAHLRPNVHIVDEVALALALTKVFGSNLPEVTITEERVEIDLSSHSARSDDQTRRSAMALSLLISEAYTEQELANFVTKARAYRREKKGSQ